MFIFLAWAEKQRDIAAKNPENWTRQLLFAQASVCVSAEAKKRWLLQFPATLFGSQEENATGCLPSTWPSRDTTKQNSRRNGLLGYDGLHRITGITGVNKQIKPAGFLFHSFLYSKNKLPGETISGCKSLKRVKYQNSSSVATKFQVA